MPRCDLGLSILGFKSSLVRESTGESWRFGERRRRQMVADNKGIGDQGGVMLQR